METKVLIDITNPIANLIFPRRCLSCNLDIVTGDICVSCLSLCIKYPNKLPIINSDWSAIFYYEFVIRKLIKNAKFHSNFLHADLLLSLLSKEMHTSGLLEEIKSFSPTVITFVPTHWINRIVRGIDLPELFSLWLSQELGIFCQALLQRRSWNGRQVLRSTKAERKIGIRGSLVAKKSAHYSKILLVDDIVTTGATFDESKKILNQLSDNIKCLAMARTP